MNFKRTQIPFTKLLSFGGLFLLAALSGESATTTDTEPAALQGASAATLLGDYVSASTGGLDTYYAYFLEVPAGISALEIDIWDADVGMGSDTGETDADQDRIRSSWNTEAVYTLLNPGGTSQTLEFTTGDSSGPASSDQAWLNIFTLSSGITAGHWELRIDMGSGDDVHYVGVRAHDGDETSAGTEVNIYQESYATYGTNESPSPQSYTHYPWITSGCTFDTNDFDWDSSGDLEYSTPDGTSFQTFSSLSGNDVWTSNETNTFTTNDSANDYGIWTLDVEISVNGILPNYGQVYVGSDEAASPAPTSQPEDDTFRIYLRKDDGDPPDKPFMEQHITWISGDNPPTVNNPTIFAVTVSVTNPTGAVDDITFSATNTVLSNIPGSGVVYNGNAVVTTGTILSQPTVGGTGDITWNPGTLAPGDTETMFYQITVTPAVAGELEVTGDVGSGDGTQATWVDETGNTTQSRATYTFGELCPLRIDATDSTLALVGNVAAIPHPDGTVVEWSTAAQAGTASFQLERQSNHGAWVPVGPSVPAALSQVQGALYRVLDKSGSRSDHHYRIVEKETTGAFLVHGPYLLKANWDRNDEPLSTDFAVITKPLDSATPLASTLRRPNGTPSSRVDLILQDRGFYRLSTLELASATGQYPKWIASLVQSHRISLENQGQPIAWKASADGLSLEFFAERLQSPYTLDNVYRLKLDTPGRAFPISGSGSQKRASGRSFIHQERFEVDDQPVFLLPLDPEGDFWAWGLVRADQGSQAQSRFDFEVVDPAQGQSEITLDLWGGATGAHRVELSIGGTYLGEINLEDLEQVSSTFVLPKGVLQEGLNQLELTATEGSLVFLDGFELAYPRLLEAHGNRLEASVDRAATVRGFTDPRIRVLDLSNPALPLELSPTITFARGEWQVTFAPAHGGAAHWLTTENAMSSVNEIRPVGDSPLTTHQEGDYVIITSEALRSGANSLASYRAVQGLSPLVLTVEEIQGEFSHGIADPRAIRDFLEFAWTQWSTPPRYVVLVGDGHWDYRNLLGTGVANSVPPLMALADGRLPGLFATDALYADTMGNDGRPEIALGRIPADSVTDLNLWIDKIGTYEKNRGSAPGAHRILHLADNPDHGGDFEAQLDILENSVPSNFSLERLNLGESDATTIRADLFSSLTSGVALMTFDGHGGVDRLAAEGLLLSEDIPNLANAGLLPVLTAATCYINYSAIPGYDALGEKLTMDETQGAVAVVAPVWLSGSDFGRRVLSRFYNHLFSGDHRLGEALRASLGLVGNAENYSLRLRWTLLGDPALIFQGTPVETPPSGGGGG